MVLRVSAVSGIEESEVGIDAGADSAAAVTLANITVVEVVDEVRREGYGVAGGDSFRLSLAYVRRPLAGKLLDRVRSVLLQIAAHE